MDQIDTDDWFDLTIINPDPPRTASQRFVALDIIITQSLDSPRFAGLVTVMSENRLHFDIFSVACSFAEHIGGYDIITAADVAGMCRHNTCRITFGWQDIPNTLQPTHDTGHGDVFQVLVLNAAAELVHMTSQPRGPTAPVTSSSSRIDHNDPAPENPCESDGTSPPRSPTLASSSTGANRFMTALHLFQLHGQEIVMHLVNAQLVQPSHEMATALNVPLQHLEAVYPIPTRPVDFPELAIPAIVQRTGDVPRRSTDRLILIDTRYLFPQAPNEQPRDPTVIRTVHRIGYQVLRSHLLLTAGVFHYCQFFEDQCELSLDGTDWPRHDHGSRPTRHGSYVLITVPPYPNSTLDTQMAVETLQEDQESDAFMNFLTEPEEADDDTALFQYAATQSPKPTTGSRFAQNLKKLGNAQDVPDQLPTIHKSKDRLLTLGAVLQPKVVMNTQCPGTEEGPQPANPDSTVKHDLQCFKQCCQAEQIQASTSRGIQDANASTKGVQQQTKIGQFFKKKGQFSKCKGIPKGQTSLKQFFQPRCISNAVRDELPVPPTTDNCNAIDHFSVQGRVSDAHLIEGISHPHLQHRCSDQQTESPPDFNVPIPAQPLPQGTAQRPRPIWMIELTSLFEEYARTHQAATGPEMSIDVWYVHHTTMPRCTAPRMVRLDNIFDLWYADICTVWFDHIHRQEPLKVLIVKPMPTHAMRSQAVVHVILEQGMTPGKVALHFTTVFHGGSRQGILQVAESVPDSISTNMMIEMHDLWPFCVERPCHMWSGILRFQTDQPEEIFSGMSAVLNVHESAHLTSTASSSQSYDVDAMSFMQRPIRPPVIPEEGRTQTMQQIPERSEASPHAIAPPTGVSDAIPATAHVPPNSMPLLHIRDIASFRQALAWQIDQLPPLCAMQPHRQLTVHTWFSDVHRLPRSDHFRAVLLGQLPMHWPFEILNRWQDWLDPTQDVTLQLVQPHPLGGDPNVAAHVIVIQAQNPATRAAVLTVVEMLEDPWHPTSFCTQLPSQVTEQVIIQEVGITDRCRPFRPNQMCEITHGSIVIQGQMTFPVRNGYQFEIALSSLDEEWDTDVTLIQISFTKIQKQIRSLHSLVDHSFRSGPRSHPNREQEPTANAISVTITPPLREGTPSSSFHFLTFHSVLQSAWQPLSLLSARQDDPSVTVVSWYIDHVRLPQCFASRAVQLYQDPEEWTHLLRMAWSDFVLLDQPLHFHIVQPNPIEMEIDVALHVILVQHSIDNFNSVLVNVVDSALEGFPPQRHASMAPHVIPYHTLLGIAYKDQEC